MINDYYDINFKMLDDFCKALGCSIILRRETINDATTCKSLRVSRSNKPLKLFLVELFCILSYLLLICLLNIYHMFLIEQFEVIFLP